MDFETARTIANRVFLEVEMKDVPLTNESRDALAATIQIIANQKSKDFNFSEFLDDLPKAIYSPKRRD